MRKCTIWILLLGAGFSLFAQTNPSISIFLPPITGISKNQSDNEAITKIFANEITLRDCIVVDSTDQADFILYGTVAPYYEEQQHYDEYTMYELYKDMFTQDASANITTYTYNALLQDSPDQTYILQLALKNNKTNISVVHQNLFYSSLEDVYDYFPLLIHNIFTHMKVRPAHTQTYSEDWRNKWLYLRASFDFPITFYTLKSDGLIAGSGIYNGTFENPQSVQQLDNKVVALPAMTLGVEVQLLNWLSIEPTFQVSWEYLNDQDYINLTAGLELKFPLKFLRSIMLEPYGAAIYPFFSSSSGIFDTVPLQFAFGGGFQISTRGGRHGAIFIDINYMYYYDDTVVYNPYKALHPKPDVIHYQRSVIGLGIGYKFGIFNRK